MQNSLNRCKNLCFGQVFWDFLAFVAFPGKNLLSKLSKPRLPPRIQFHRFCSGKIKKANKSKKTCPKHRFLQLFSEFWMIYVRMSPPENPKNQKKTVRNIVFYSYLVIFEWFMLECLSPESPESQKKLSKHWFLQPFSDFGNLDRPPNLAIHILAKSLNSCTNHYFGYFFWFFGFSGGDILT